MGKIKETIKKAATSWIKKFRAIIIGVFTGILGLFAFGRIKDVIKKHDNAKKEELRDKIDETKEDMTEAVKGITEAKETAEKIIEAIKEHEKKSEEATNDYVTQQQNLAEEAGFVKKS